MSVGDRGQSAGKPASRRRSGPETRTGSHHGAAGRMPSAVGAVLESEIARRRWTRRLEGVAVIERWPEVVGEQLADRCEPVRLVGDVLVIRAESSVWATQITYLAGTIVGRVSDVLGPGLVSDVRVVVGPQHDHGHNRTDR